MILRIDHVAQAHTIAINPRRLFYLPATCFVACVLALPLRRRQRARALWVGTGVLLLLALASLWILAAWLFAQVSGLVYALAPWQHAALHLAYEGLVTPIANKFIVPLVLALGLFAALTSFRNEARAPGLDRLNARQTRP